MTNMSKVPELTPRQKKLNALTLANKQAKALRREAFINHKKTNGGDYTRVKTPRFTRPSPDE